MFEERNAPEVARKNLKEKKIVSELARKKVKTFEGENIVSEFARKQDHLRMNVALDRTITLDLI